MAFTWKTNVKLISIPDYRINTGNVKLFKTEQERDNYFDAHVVQECEWDSMSYARLNGGMLRVPINADELTAKNINWVKFKNSNFGNKWFYANIIGDPKFINKNVSEINYSVDYLTTYFFDLDLTKESFISRRTISKNDTDSFIVNLPLEDLNAGSNYLTASTFTDYINSDEDFSTGVFFYVLLTKPLCSTGNSHEIRAQAITLTNTDGTSTTISNGIPSVLYGYILNYDCLLACYNQGLFGEDCDLVNALMMTVKLPFGRELFPQGISNIASKISTSSNPNFGVNLPSTCECYEQTKFGYLHKESTVPSSFFTNLNEVINSITGENGKAKPTCGIGRMLLKYPYSLLQVYDYVNQPVNIKLNELNVTNDGDQYSFMTNGLKIHKYGSIGQTPTFNYSIERLNNNTSDAKLGQSIDDGGVGNLQSISFFTVTGTFTLPIINNALQSFLQSNANQINAQRSNIVETYQTQVNNAGATLQTANLTAGLSYSNNMYTTSQNYINATTNANLAFVTSATNTGREYGALYAQTIANSAASMSGSLVRGTTGMVGASNAGQYTHALGDALSGGLMAATQGVTQIGVQNAQQSNAIANANLDQLTAINNASTHYNTGIKSAETARDIAIADANTSYGNAMRNASLNYNTQMRSLNARVQDIANMPSTVQTMGNYQSIANYMLNRDGVTFQLKTLPKDILKRLATYWVYNGVLVSECDSISNIINKFKDAPGFYIQTVNGNITGNVPPYALQQIQSQFDSGIYFWTGNNFRNYEKMFDI